MVKRVLKILTIILLIIGPTSCYLFEGCPDASPYFKINGLEIYNLEYIEQTLILGEQYLKME